MDTCTTDSFFCTLETNTTLKKNNYTSIKKAKKKNPKKQTSNKTTTTQKKSYCLLFSPEVCGARDPSSWESRVSPPEKSLLQLVSDRITFFVGWGQVRDRRFRTGAKKRKAENEV